MIAVAANAMLLQANREVAVKIVVATCCALLALSTIVRAETHALSIPGAAQAVLAPSIQQQLGGEEELLTAPVGTIETFGYSYRYIWKGSDPFSSTTGVTYKRLSEPGFFAEYKDYKEGDGYTRTSTVYLAAGGLLPLSEEGQKTEPDGTKGSLSGHLIEYDISGDLFPVATGNEFEIATTTAHDGFEMRTKETCTVKHALAASEVDTKLQGRAFYVVCRLQVADEKGGQDYFYVEELGFFLPNFRPADCRECSDYELTLAR